jgi:putative transcriptional regulator
MLAELEALRAEVLSIPQSDISSAQVKEMRELLGLTQQGFADKFGLAIDTIRSWEQGRRPAKGPAKAFLNLLRYLMEKQRRP